MDRVLMWSAQSWPGLEHLLLRETPEGIDFDGLVVASCRW